MNVDISTLKKNLCAAFCQEVDVSRSGDDIAIALPMTGRDGDHLMAYVRPAAGGWRVSDMGTTMMRLSYENDLSRLLTGAREKLYSSVLSETGLQEDDGEIYAEVSADELNRGLFTLAQGITRIEDLGLWTRQRIESTFSDDLRDLLIELVGSDEIEENYTVPEFHGSEDYQVDYKVKTPTVPLFVFGVGNKDKARLTTITLQHLRQYAPKFDSMVICQDIEDLPKMARTHLLNAANDVVPSITNIQVIREKLAHRRAA